MSDAYSLGLNFESDELNDAISELEGRHISSIDLITLEASDLGKRANIPVATIEQLRQGALRQLHEVTKHSQPLASPASARSACISTLDTRLDEILGGGFRPGHVHEIVGPSGAGKTQWLLTALLSAQLPAPHGISRPSLYISTEHPLPTQRVAELIASNPVLLSASPRPSLDRILTLNATDMEVQEHILNFQLPIVLARQNMGLVIIDSIAANYRGEALSNSKQGRALSDRSADLIKLGALLRNMALKYDCAIVCANQVADRLDPIPRGGAARMEGQLTSPMTGPVSSSPIIGPAPSNLSPMMSSPMQLQSFTTISEAVMTLDHQQKWFTGWGDARSEFAVDSSRRAQGTTAKVPALGMIWSNQVSCRIALYKSAEWASKRLGMDTSGDGSSGPAAMKVDGADWTPRRHRRWARLVFAPWAEESAEDDPGVEFEIWSGGLKHVEQLHRD